MANTVNIVGITNFPAGTIGFTFPKLDRTWLKLIESGLANGATQNYKSVYQLLNPNEEVDSELPRIISQSERRKWNREGVLAKTASIETTANLKDANGEVLDTCRVKVNVTIQATKDWGFAPKSLHPLTFALHDLVWNDPDGTFSDYTAAHGLAETWPANVTEFQLA